MNRTHGNTRNCAGCRYWSEMLAQAGGEIDGVQAMCINKESEAFGKYRNGWHSCAHWASGFDGAVDEPGTDPERYETLKEEP